MKLFCSRLFNFIFLAVATRYFRSKRFFKREDKINVYLDQETIKTQIPEPPDLPASLPQTPLGADQREGADS